MSEELCSRARSTRRTTPFSAFTRGKNCSALMNAPWYHSNLGGRYAAFLKRSLSFLSCSWDVRGRRAIDSFFFAFSIIIIIIILQIFVSRVYERKWSDLAFSLPPLQLLADEVEMRRFLKRPRRQLSALLLLLFLLCIIINNNKRRKRLLGKKAMLFLMEWRVSVRVWR